MGSRAKAPASSADEIFHTDVNLDSAVDGLDLLLVAGTLGAWQDDLEYDQTLDVHRDGGIDVLDLAMVRPSTWPLGHCPPGVVR